MAKKKTSPKPLRSALVVLGMHRSGTSALAGVLAKMGADLPQDLMGPAEQNAKGFFESNKVTGLNEELLASAGHRWFTYDPVPSDWFASPKAIEFEERAVELLLEEYGRSHLFVLKDPRMCRLLPFWQKALKQAGCRPLHICTHRHPLDVAASLNRVSAYETDYAVHLWLRHALEAEAASRGHARVFTSYKRLMTDSVEVVTNIGAGVDLKWPRSPRSAVSDMETFLSKDLQHFRQSDDPDRRDASLPDWVAETFEIFETWVAEGEREDDYQRLDRILATTEKTGPILGPVLWHNQEKRWNIKGLRDQITHLEGAVHAARQEAASHAANHATEQKMRGAVEHRLAELTASFESLRASHDDDQKARAAAEAKIAELDRARAAARAEAEALQAKHMAEKERYRVLAESHDALEASHDALDKELGQIRQERDQLRSQLEQSRAEAEDLHRQTALDAGRIAELEADLELLATKHAALERKSEYNARHLSAMTQQLAIRLSQDIDRRLNEGSAKEDDQRARDAAEARIAELNQALSAAQAEVDALQTSYDSEQQARATRIAELEEKLNQRSREAEERFGEIARVSEILLESQTQAGTLHKEIEQLKQQERLARQRVAELEASTSWRITGPLRRIVTFFRR